MTNSVDHLSAQVKTMAERWPVIDALMGGTLAMRDAGKQLLPQWPNEEDDAYAARLRTATLFPAYRRTVSVMAGKPFAKALTLSEDTPAQMQGWSNDIDMEGVNLHTFCSEMFFEAIGWGLGGILVESPKQVSTSVNRAPTVKEQREAGMRPYFVRVKHDQICGWRTTRRGGATILTQLRIRECATEDEGDYGETEVPRIRVLRPGAYEVFEKRGKAGTWTQIDEGTTGLNVITFVPVYGFRRRFMVGEPPLEDVAHLNVKHWQSQSDQDTLMHFARVPILFGRQLGEEKIVIGGSAAVKGEYEHSDLKYVEHTGQAIGAGRQSLLDLEEQMIQSGAELLVKKPGQRSATEAANDADANKCDLQRIAEGFEDSIDLALHYMAMYASLPKGGNASLFKDFAANSLTEASGTLVLDMQSRGLISKVTTIKEQQRRGTLSADIDPEQEIAAASLEGPEPGDLTDDE